MELCVCVGLREKERASIALVALLLLLILMVWVPVSAADTHAETSALAATVTVQTTPTVDPTMTALQKEQLNLQVIKLKQDTSWLSILSSIGPVYVGLLAATFATFQYSRNTLAERQKRLQEDFQKAIEGLSGERVEQKVGAAVTLESFLQPYDSYKPFHTQLFELVVAHLQLRKATLNTPEPLDPLSRRLINEFRYSYPLARSRLKGKSLQPLDATGVQLDRAYLVNADLRKMSMPRASLRDAVLSGADLSEVNLEGADLTGVNLEGADLTGVNIGDARSLKDTNLRGVKGLTKEQLEACEAKGAIIDEDAAPSLP